MQLQLRHTTPHHTTPHYTTLKFSLMASVKTEDDLSAAVEKIGIMLEQDRQRPGFFVLRKTWVLSGFVAPNQVVTIPLKDFFDKWSRLLVAIAAAAGSVETLTPLCPPLPFSHARYLSKLIRAAEDLTNPHTVWLLSSNYWFRPILTELLGAAQEPDGTNRQRAPAKLCLRLWKEHVPLDLTRRSPRLLYRASKLPSWPGRKIVKRLLKAA